MVIGAARFDDTPSEEHPLDLVNEIREKSITPFMVVIFGDEFRCTARFAHQTFNFLRSVLGGGT